MINCVPIYKSYHRKIKIHHKVMITKIIWKKCSSAQVRVRHHNIRNKFSGSKRQALNVVSEMVCIVFFHEQRNYSNAS